MYSNDYKQIRNGLVNYIGSLLKACPFEGEKAARQYVAATLIEEALDLMKNEESYDMYIAKPLLRGNKIVLQNRKNEIAKLPQSNGIKATIKTYEDNLDFLNNLINSIN